MSIEQIKGAVSSLGRFSPSMLLCHLQHRGFFILHLSLFTFLLYNSGLLCLKKCARG